MFERRVRLLIAALGVAAVVLILRLGQLQLVRGDYYRAKAEQTLVQKAQWLPSVRGSIRDRSGRTLVSDEPCWDITVDYSVIAAHCSNDSSVWRDLLRRWRRQFRALAPSPDVSVEPLLRTAVEETWLELSAFEGLRNPSLPGDISHRAQTIHARVQAVRGAVAARRGFDAPVAEETERHAVATSLDSAEQIEARIRFGRFPWLHVEPSSERRFHGPLTAMAHVVGRVGRVTAEDVAADPHADDPFAAYGADELRGTMGVEWVGETILRGRRGKITVDLDGHPLPGEDIAAEHGRDVTLTIDIRLQERLFELLAGAVQRVPESSGGAIVVLDARTRDVLALVSFPSYDPAHFEELYPALRDDTRRLPLRFRAVSNRYVPGSTIKPLVCLAGLMNGVISLESREECRGYLFEEYPDRWRCWQVHGTSQRKAHGSIDVVEALTGSCNVFMYRLGERLGVDRLCNSFDMVGIGRSSGIGLREEDRGINPTPSWLMTNKNLPVSSGTARLFAIGQGEISVTPLQLANLMATYANGKYRPVRLIRELPVPPEWTLPASPELWLAIKRGMYGVVNDPSGTAYDHAHFVHEHYALVGKTGSATAYPWPVTYRVPFTDESGAALVALVPSGTKHHAIERFMSEHPNAVFDRDEVEVASEWPPHPPIEGEHHAHAWFGGFLQAKKTNGEPDWSHEPAIAFAVLVEFGGSGGRVSGPLAKEIAAALVETLGPELQIDPAPQ